MLNSNDFTWNRPWPYWFLSLNTRPCNCSVCVAVTRRLGGGGIEFLYADRCRVTGDSRICKLWTIVLYILRPDRSPWICIYSGAARFESQPGQLFLWFCSAPWDKFRDSILIRLRPLPYNSFPVRHLSYSTLCSLATDSVVEYNSQSAILY
jgi:hypothetical protein